MRCGHRFAEEALMTTTRKKTLLHCGILTGILGAVVLLIFGTGSIKGFASTLIISVVVSFFTATFITRWLLKSFVNLGFTKKWLYTR